MSTERDRVIVQLKWAIRDATQLGFIVNAFRVTDDDADELKDEMYLFGPEPDDPPATLETIFGIPVENSPASPGSYIVCSRGNYATRIYLGMRIIGPLSTSDTSVTFPCPTPASGGTCRVSKPASASSAQLYDAGISRR
jgi:hypothetical protein